MSGSSGDARDRDACPTTEQTLAQVTGYEALAQALCRHEATVYGVPGLPATELGDAWATAAGAPPPWSVNERVAFEMVHRDQRLVMRERDGLAGQKPDHDAADEAGAGGGGDAVEIGEFQFCVAHGGGDRAVEAFNVSAGGNFGNYPFVGRVLRGLAKHDIGEDVRAAPVQAQHRGRGFIAAGFNAENSERLHAVRR